MELLKFEGETLMDDGGIVRRIKVKGDGYLNPNDGAWVNGKSPYFLPGSILISRLANTSISNVRLLLRHSAPGRDLRGPAVRLQRCELYRG